MYTQKVWQNKSNLSKPDYIMCVERYRNGRFTEWFWKERDLRERERESFGSNCRGLWDRSDKVV
jgi:hypothetical protein